METKSVNRLYWTITVIFVLAYGMGAIFDALAPPPVVQVTEHLGYPVYFIRILGILKLCAIVAILVPEYPRIKEWAYAGITFNLLFASLSHIMVGDPIAGVMLPLVFLAFAVGSYVLWHKKENHKK